LDVKEGQQTSGVAGICSEILQLRGGKVNNKKRLKGECKKKEAQGGVQKKRGLKGECKKGQEYRGSRKRVNQP
jgi:hypothetical protein